MNICLITDDNYIKYTLACITSICMSNYDDTINFYILAGSLQNKNIQILKSFHYRNNTLRVIIVDRRKYSSLKCERYLTWSMFIKFDIPNILSGIDRIIYIDGDTIVMKSLHDLYKTNLGSKYGAVVKDFGKLTIWRDEAIDSIKNNLHFYSGQMLLNLKKMREDKITDKLFKTKIENQNLMDEEVFNKVMIESVLYLDPKYCVSYEKIISHKKKEYNDIEKYNAVYGTNYKTIKDLVNNAVIFHFHGDKIEVLKNQIVYSFYNYIFRKSVYLFDLM